MSNFKNQFRDEQRRSVSPKQRQTQNLYESNEFTLRKETQQPESPSFSPIERRGHQRENVSPSKDVIDYYQSQLKQVEGKLEQKQRDLILTKNQLNSLSSDFKEIQTSNSHLNTENQILNKKLRIEEEKSQSFKVESQKAHNEIERITQLLVSSEKKKQDVLDNLNLKKQEMENLNYRHNQIKEDLLQKLENQQISYEKEINLQRQKSEQLENHLKREIESLNVENKGLLHELNRCNQALKETQIDLQREINQKLETEKNLNYQKQLNDQNCQKYEEKLKIQEEIFEQKLLRQKQLHKHEQDQLRRDIEALLIQLEHKKVENNIERSNIHQVNKELIDAHKKIRIESLEKDYFKTKSSQIQRQSPEKLQTQSDIQRLKSSYHEQLLKKEIENELLQKQDSLNQKELDKIKSEKKRKELEAEIYKLKLQEVEQQRVFEAQKREALFQQEKQELNRSYSLEREILHNQVTSLNKEIIHKSLEANEWKNNYAKVAFSPIKTVYRY